MYSLPHYGFGHNKKMSCTQECTFHSGISVKFLLGIRNPGLWNTEYSSRIPEPLSQLKSGIHVPLTNNPESSTWNPESMIVLGSPVTYGEMLCRDILAYNEIMVEPDLHVFSVRLSKLNETIDHWKWAQYIIIPLSTLSVIFVTGEREQAWFEVQVSPK